MGISNMGTSVKFHGSKQFFWPGLREKLCKASIYLEAKLTALALDIYSACAQDGPQDMERN